MTNGDSPPGWAEVIRPMERVAQEFVEALYECNKARLSDLVDSENFCWERVLRAVAVRGGSIDADLQDWFLQVWLDRGAELRILCSNDLILVPALRVLMPPYDGPARVLYRGESERNERDRTYGMSWTDVEAVAEQFASPTYRFSKEGVGGVVIKALVASDAIISAVKLIDNRYGESEFLVDRTRLDAVEVVSRHPMSSAEEYERQRQIERDEYKAEQARLRKELLAGRNKPAETP